MYVIRLYGMYGYGYGSGRLYGDGVDKAVAAGCREAHTILRDQDGG